MNNKNIDQQKLISLLREQNPEALGVIYDEVAPVLFGIALRIINDEVIAGEVLEQAILYIRKNYSSFDESKQSLCVWMINILRKIAQEKVPFKSYLQNQHSISYVDIANENHKPENIQDFRITKTGISVMTIEQRKVIDLIFFGGGKISEVAEHLAIEECKVKQLLREAILKHRKESPQAAWK